jgi:hypothetical protein
MASTISSNAKVSANGFIILFIDRHQLMIGQATHPFFRLWKTMVDDKCAGSVRLDRCSPSGRF